MEPQEYDEATKRSAYLQAMKLKQSGLNKEIIYARLEKQGIPEQLIFKILKDLKTEHKMELQEEAQFNFKLAFLKIGIGIFVAIVSWLLLPGMVIVPVGLILGGIILALTTSSQA